MLCTSLKTSFSQYTADSYCARGPVIQEGCTPNRKGVTRARSMNLDSAPASKFIQGFNRLYGVTQMMPYSASFRSRSTTSPHLDPLLMSLDKNGRTGWIIKGSHSYNAFATDRK